ncbi:MAG: 30S ribosomal protein S3 [Candidatus Diapherotrites archaeon]|nr:30S ribosomal protein S3 [Candidatus Diapherotrites archaeon]
MIERNFVEQGLKKIQFEQFVKEHMDKAGFTGLEIVKTPLVTRIVLNVARPGLAIGKSGQNIKQLTLEISQRFGIQNPQIEIRDIKNPELDSKATVDRMIGLVERGYSWRSVAFRTAQGIMTAGAQGVELIFSGKLSGKGGRKRKLRIAQGYMKKVGDEVKKVDYAKGSAYPKAGAIGIKLRIIHPGVVFPDKINIKEILDKRDQAAAQATAAAAAAAAPAVAIASVPEEEIAKDHALVAVGTAVVAVENAPAAVVQATGEAKVQKGAKVHGEKGADKKKGVKKEKAPKKEGAKEKEHSAENKEKKEKESKEKK